MKKRGGARLHAAGEAGVAGSAQGKGDDAAEHEDEQSGRYGHIDWITHASPALAFQQSLS